MNIGSDRFKFLIKVIINIRILKRWHSCIEKNNLEVMELNNVETSMMHHQNREDYCLNSRTNSVKNESEESSFFNSSSSTSDEEDEDEPVDALKDKGWMDEVSVPQSQLQHEMNGQILPSINPSDFGDVCIKNSSNVHLGSRVFYKGPVTIKQFVYTNSAAMTDDISNEESQYNKKDFKENNTDNTSKSPENSTLSNCPSLPLYFFSNRKVAEWFWTKQFIFTVSLLTSVAMSISVLSIWLSDPTIAKVRIVPRIEWGAQPPSQPPTPLSVLPAPYVIISHTASVFCYTQAQCVLNVRVAQTFHIESKGWNDIGYNFLVGGDGLVYEGRGWGIEGAHSFGYNYKSIGISFIGTFNDVEPTKAQLHAAKKLIELGVEQNSISTNYKLLGHRQFTKTESPGEVLYNIIKTWDHWSTKP